MESPIERNFDTWLSRKLLNLNQDVDLDVFVSYISGILEADTPEDEKSESLFGILGELVQSSAIEDECQEIIKKWKELSSENTERRTSEDVDNIDFKIHSIIEQQNVQASRVKTVSKESQERKAVILAQYAEISDGEDLDDVHGEGKAVASASSGAAAAAATTSTAALSNEELLVRNMNALLVKERERNERDRAKQEAEHKKQKDKEDRERQKQKAQERKETEKKRTQKGDKKR